MFELNYPTYQNVLSSVETLETELQKMFENHRDSVLNLSLDWHGSTSLVQRNLMVKSLSSGSHYEALRYTSGLRKIMEDYQIPIEQLMARREQLGEQLMQDDYVTPDLSCHTENDLIIDYTMLDVLKGNCKMALTYGKGAADVVSDMITEAQSIASEWVNFSGAQDVLDSGIKKINRLENYITELTLFKSGMSNLEYDLIYEMYVVIRELGDTTLEFAEFKPPIAQPRQLISSVEDHRLIEPDEVKKVLAKDAEDWTLDDAIYIAGAWSFYLEQQDQEMVNAIVQSLFIFDDVTYRTDMGILPAIYRDYVTAEPDIEKIQMLLDNLDPITNSQAYYTLDNLSEVEPMRIRVKDNWIGQQSGTIMVLMSGLKKKVPYLTLSFYATSGEGMLNVEGAKEVKVYIHDLEDQYSDEVKDTMDTLDITVDEIEEILREYDLTKNFDEYESMSEQEKANYDALAWLATMAMLPDTIPVPGTYTLPVGDGITITYSVSAKGTITDGEISTTIEMQKKELKSLTYSKDNADLIINGEEVSVNVKSEIEGLDAKVGSSFELGMSGFGGSVSLEEGESITSIETNMNVDGTIAVTYAVETKVSENSSISSELEIKKEKTNDDLPGWEPVGIQILENLPEPVRDFFENPVVLPGPMPIPIPVF